MDPILCIRGACLGLNKAPRSFLLQSRTFHALCEVREIPRLRIRIYIYMHMHIRIWTPTSWTPFGDKCSSYPILCTRGACLGLQQCAAHFYLAATHFAQCAKAANQLLPKIETAANQCAKAANQCAKAAKPQIEYFKHTCGLADSLRHNRYSSRLE